METISKKEFEEKYGIGGTMLFDEQEKKSSLLESVKSQIKEAAVAGVEKMERGFDLAKTGRTPLEGVESGLKVGAGAIETATSPLAPLLAPIGEGVAKTADIISDIPAVQKFSETEGGKVASRVAEDIQDVSVIAGGSLGARTTPTIARGVSQAGVKAGEAVGSAFEKIPSSKAIGEAIQDVVPKKQALIDSNLARALDLTPGDLRNIEASTGNPVGRWMSDNNLIGNNKAETVGQIKSFFEKNYSGVRDEIGKVSKVYSATDVPRYTESLNAVLAQTNGKLGLEVVNREITNLLKKEEISLADVQRAKELLDEHFSLYKATGDVQSGVVKQGLAKVRQELKTFIEKEVLEETGADIQALNNNVATARSLADAIEARAPRGLTRANISWRDVMVGMGVYAFSSPVAGLAAVLAWKLATSAPARLRFARWLDTRSDAQKAKINNAFKKGEVPDEVKELLELNEKDLPPIEF